AGARARLGHVAGAGRRPAHGPRVARGVLAGHLRAVAGVGRAGVAVVGAERAARLLRVRRAVGAVAGTALRHVARPGRRPAHCPRIARGVLAGDVRAVAGVGRAGVAVVGAGRAARLLRVGGAVGTVTGTALRHVTLAGGGAADARGLEAV